jgi:hypothetical protein
VSQITSSRRTAKLLAVTATCAAVVVALPSAAQAFNPQPDPPGVQASLVLNPGVLVGFNPQPDPPGVIRIGVSGRIIPPDPVLPPDPIRVAR